MHGCNIRRYLSYNSHMLKREEAISAIIYVLVIANILFGFIGMLFGIFFIQ